MPSIFSHAAFAVAVGRSALGKTAGTKVAVLTALCAILPDADGIAFVFRVSHGSMFGHRGITHSIFFAVLMGCIVSLFAFRRSRPLPMPWLITYFSAATLSHPLLDMLTNGGSGVALLAPFSSQRFFFPWRPIEVSPIGMGFFSERGVEVFASELLWVWLPAVIILAGSIVYHRFLQDGTSNQHSPTDR
jgi:inner membrane protein